MDKKKNFKKNQDIFLYLWMIFHSLFSYLDILFQFIKSLKKFNMLNGDCTLSTSNN